MPINSIPHDETTIHSGSQGIESMLKLFVVLGLTVLVGVTGCGSTNPDAPSAPSESDVPKGDGSAPQSSPGVLKPPSGKKTVENSPAEL